MNPRLPAGREVVVTHALRTPIGKYLGSFADLTAADLGASVVRDLIERSGVPANQIGELIFGNGRQAGGGPNVARQRPSPLPVSARVSFTPVPVTTASTATIGPAVELSTMNWRGRLSQSASAPVTTMPS